MGCGSVSERTVQIPIVAPLNSVYKRLQLIGSGTFGKVYKCLNQINGLYFALKVVDMTAGTREEAIKQVDILKRQIRVLKKLSHPNIVKYYSFDIGEDSKQVEIVLEFAQKGSLKKYVQEKGALSESEAAAKTEQILQGLNYLHRQNIVHRDLKCANILVMEDNTLKITDFGTAKYLKQRQQGDRISKQNIALCPSLRGTPYYMAPEVLRRTGHTLSADVWGLGCLVIEMLSGKAPWLSLTTDFEEIIGYILSGIHPPFPNGVSDECSDFLKGCFKAVGSERPTCQELLCHKWIRRVTNSDRLAERNRQSQGYEKYKNSLSKTNDEYEEVFQGKIDRKNSREEKMRQIDNYLFERNRDKKREKGKVKVERESARAKRDRTAKLVYSEEQIGAADDIQELQVLGINNRQPLARKLFAEEEFLSGRQSLPPKQPKGQQNYQTTPNVKLPEQLISQQTELQQQQFLQSSLDKKSGFAEATPIVEEGSTRIKTEKKPREAVIDTFISREERLRFLDQQRILREQREEQRLRWEQQLKEGANYLRKEINSRYAV